MKVNHPPPNQLHIDQLSRPANLSKFTFYILNVPEPIGTLSSEHFPDRTAAIVHGPRPESQSSKHQRAAAVAPHATMSLRSLALRGLRWWWWWCSFQPSARSSDVTWAVSGWRVSWSSSSSSSAMSNSSSYPTIKTPTLWQSRDAQVFAQQVNCAFWHLSRCIYILFNVNFNNDFLQCFNDGWLCLPKEKYSRMAWVSLHSTFLHESQHFIVIENTLIYLVMI